MPGTIRKRIPHDVLPECIEKQATLAEQMKQTSDILKDLVITVKGNGKVGLQETTSQNTRDIAEIVTSLREENSVRNKETEVRQAETIARTVETQVRQKETDARELETKAREAETVVRKAESLKRRNDVWKWWMTILSALIFAAIAIAQAIATQAALARLAALVKLSP
jgi:hypothetical protein